MLDEVLLKYLDDANIDILHGHGIWDLTIHYMAKWGRKRKVRYIISTRGMLEPWALNFKKWKKKVAYNVYQKRDLQYASCVHATACKETRNIVNLGFKNNIATISNGIDITSFPIKETNIEKDSGNSFFFPEFILLKELKI
nr:glycosyltransferase [Pontibacter sp. BAB1700]